MTNEHPIDARIPWQASTREVAIKPPFDLARTVAPVWWARGRWPNVDWSDGVFRWVGWERGNVVRRFVRQTDEQTLEISGSGNPDLDHRWASRIIGIDCDMPRFQDPVLMLLAMEHEGMKPWAAGSHFEGVISSVVGQSISVAAAAMTERRLFAMFNDAIEIDGRRYWPPPAPHQLASASAGNVRTSGVTAIRAEALVEVGRGFLTGELLELDDPNFDRVREGEKLRAISGIGPWTVRSALLWGIGDPDAHPTGDVALLRAVRRRHANVSTLRELDQLAERWRPHRSWAARLYWLDLLGFEENGALNTARHIR